MVNIGNVGKLLFLFFLFNVVHGVLYTYECDSTSFEFKVFNNDTMTHSYVINKGGTAAQWAVLTTGFVLQPGQTKVVSVFVSVPCGTPTGDYQLKLSVVRDDALVKDESKIIRITPAHYIEITPIKGVINSCVNDEVIASFNVSNKGNFTELINFSSDGTLFQDKLFLNPGDYQIINVSFIPKKLGANVFYVYANFTNGHSQATQIINATQCTSFFASVSPSFVSLCENDISTIKLYIKNIGNESEFYIKSNYSYLNISSPINIGKDEEKTIDIYVFSGCASGINSTKIVVYKPGSVEYTFPIIINNKRCFQPIVVPEKESDYLCSCENVSYKFNIYNPGNQEVEYSLVSEGSIFYENNQIFNITLEPNTDKQVIVNYTIPCTFSGEYNLSLKATAIHACAKEDTGVIKLKVLPWSKCEEVKISSPSVMPVNGSKIVVPVVVSNVGIRPASYNILITGSAVNNILGVSQSFTTLNPGESKSVEITLSADNISGRFINIEVYSVDNLARASTVVSFGNSFFNFSMVYYLIPIAVLSFFVLRKLFNKPKSKSNNGKGSDTSQPSQG